jgi:hypothetical protein
MFWKGAENLGEAIGVNVTIVVSESEQLRLYWNRRFFRLDEEVSPLPSIEIGYFGAEDLDGSDEPPWMPVAVEEMTSNNTIDEDVATTLTLLSWCHGDEGYEFATTEAVEKRQQQADYSFNQTS